jgi:hypothetical protein
VLSKHPGYYSKAARIVSPKKTEMILRRCNAINTNQPLELAVKPSTFSSFVPSEVEVQID